MQILFIVFYEKEPILFFVALFFQWNILRFLFGWYPIIWRWCIFQKRKKHSIWISLFWIRWFFAFSILQFFKLLLFGFHEKKYLLQSHESIDYRNFPVCINFYFNDRFLLLCTHIQWLTLYTRAQVLLQDIFTL